MCMTTSPGRSTLVELLSTYIRNTKSEKGKCNGNATLRAQAGSKGGSPQQEWGEDPEED